MQISIIIQSAGSDVVHIQIILRPDFLSVFLLSFCIS